MESVIRNDRLLNYTVTTICGDFRYIDYSTSEWLPSKKDQQLKLRNIALSCPKIDTPILTIPFNPKREEGSAQIETNIQEIEDSIELIDIEIT